MAVIFLVVVAANFVVFALPDPPEWVAYLALLPLLLLAMSGIYLRTLPHRQATGSGESID